MSERVIVTTGLPYANGSLHLGHLLGYIMTDVYVRALRLCGQEVTYICGPDTHGTPIELNARKENIAPEEFVARYAKEQKRDFDRFQIGFDGFHSTHTQENRRWVEEIYQNLKKAGLIHKKEIEQFYDPKAKRFLPDRFVKGRCPKCDAEDQYGDVCEVCNSTYKPTDLINPYSAVSGAPPERKTSEHLFVKLEAMTPFLQEWVKDKAHLQPEIRNFVENWLKEGLSDWCISRDAPYFGFEIPGEENKYFYVWLDAPVGYVSSTENWALAQGNRNLSDEVWREKKGRVVHVIGRDITYFHTLFWPAVLKAAGFKTPDRVQVHGMLMVNGEKMSKSRGTFIKAHTYLEHLDPTYLRYYYASKSTPNTQDLDLALDDFVQKVNADLVNNVVNLVSRSASLLSNKLEGRYGVIPNEHQEAVERAKQWIASAKDAYQNFDLAAAIRHAVANRRAGQQALSRL